MMEDLDNIQSKRRTNRDWNSLLLTDPKKQPNGRNNPLPRDELANIENKILEKKIADKKKEELRKKNIAMYGDSKRAQRFYQQDSDAEEEEELLPNPKLAQGNKLPRRYGAFPLELANMPLVDIDPYYADKRTFIVLTKSGDITRFSATKGLFLLSPFNPIRRIAISVLTHPLFSTAIISTILANCMVMIKKENEWTMSTETVFTCIYTYESAVKLLSRGFCLNKFTYMRDPWNWLDFVVVGMSYITLVVDLGQFGALRTLRVFRALKSVAVVPGLKVIVGAIMFSIKNLRDVIILTTFMLSIFALIGLQVYMGVLGQKCVKQYPTDPDELAIWGNLTDQNWDFFMHNETNWWLDSGGQYSLCGNSSGAGKCPYGYECLAGYGPNPNYGYTSFDNFPDAFLCAFRLMTQDFWENLYQITLQTAGPLNISFFILNIFLGSFYLINLILAIVAMSYDNLNSEQQAEMAAEMEELGALREVEEAAIAEAEAAAMEAANAAAGLFEFEEESANSKDQSPLKEKGGQQGQEANGVVLNPQKLKEKLNDIQPVTNQLQVNHHNNSQLVNGSSQSLRYKDVLVLNEIIDRISERPSSMLDDDDDDDDEGPKLKDIIKDYLKQGCEMFCVLDCCGAWIKIAQFMSWIVFDPFVELFITLCIAVNVVFMSLDQYSVEYDGMSPYMNSLLYNGNIFFTIVFAFESFIKLFAMGPRYFFADKANDFDFVIVVLSIVEFLAEGAKGLSMLRSFRLLRVFKLAKSWKSLNDILTIMKGTVASISNLIVVLCIIIFIFAVMGMQLFGAAYTEDVCKWDGCVGPRWHFKDFFHSFMIVFRVLCGEWIESMWDCMFLNGPICIPYFMATVLIGYLVILNLFLALLLASFTDMGGGGDDDDEPDKMAIAIGRIKRGIAFIKKMIKMFFYYLFCCCICKKKNNYDQNMEGRDNPGMDTGNPDALKSDLNSANSHLSNGKLGSGGGGKDQMLLSYMDKGMLVSGAGDGANIGRGMEIGVSGVSGALASSGSSGENSNTGSSVSSGNSDWRTKAKLSNTSNDSDRIDSKHNMESSFYMYEMPQVEEIMYDPVDEVVVMDCCPAVCYRVFPCCKGDPDSPLWQEWYKHRLQISKLIENKYFETVVLALILISSFVMTLEDVWYTTKPMLMDVLYYLDKILTVVFFLETCLKLVAMGIVAYFGNAWCWLDFIIVGVSIVNFGASVIGLGNISIFKTMRTLRALRPLRAMAKMEGMKVVIAALIGALPGIANVMAVCIIFWLIFAIIGVNFFMGQFQECVDENGERFHVDVVPNKTVCLNMTGGIWVNPRISFDNVALAYLSLFQIATFKGWMDIMDDAVDSVGLNLQPSYENSVQSYLFFVAFIVFGSFFTLNLLVGVIIDKFNEQKNKGGSLDTFMTEDQKKYIAAMKKAGSKKPLKALPRPTWGPQAVVFGIVTNKKFDMIIMGFIFLNMMSMMCDHWNQSKEWTFVLDNLNLAFIVIFTSEMFMKMFALRHYYFAEPWNLFDFFVVMMSLASLFLSDLIEKYFVSPTLLRVVRVVKVGRVLRLIKGAKGIRTLLFSLVMSMPALLNIGLLLFLVMFILAVFGMSLFKHVKIRVGFNDVHNFKTFFKTFILLFQMATTAGWDGTLNAIFDDTDCKTADPEIGEDGDCGSFGVGIAYCVAHLLISSMIIVNMFIAVILENYSAANDDVDNGITDEDYDMFYEVWVEFDPESTMYIPYENVSELIDILEPPLQIAKPNKFKIVHMDIPVVRFTNPKTGEVKDDMVFSSDLLDALTQDFFARKGNSIEEPLHVEDIKVQSFFDRPGYERTSSSLWKQREEYCATIIQQAWRDHSSQLKAGHKHKGGTKTNNAKPQNPRTEMNGKKLIEVQPSPSPEN